MILDTLKRPLRDVRISVTDRCNFRCPYCMPAAFFGDSYQFLPQEKLLSFAEITLLARLFVQLGAVKLRLTGGEPLMRPGIEKLVAMLAEIAGVEDLALTTNGYLLPQKAAALKAAGLHRLTVSLDSLDDAVFRAMNGNKSGVAEVLAGLKAAEQAGFARIKINAVIQRGVNDHTLIDLVRYCKDHGYILRLIEYMDVGNQNGWKLDEVVSAEEMIALIDREIPLQALPENYQGEVALRYGYRDGNGEVGIIASVSKPFCGSCTRLRLSAEGSMYTCLFAVQGTDLRDLLRAGGTEDEVQARLEAKLREVWGKRADRYSELRAKLTKPLAKIEMHHLGG
jgi:GTP 3',8-cyclase